MTEKTYHNKIVEWLKEWVKQDKGNFPNGEIYTTFEDIPELRDRLIKGRVPVDLRYSVDLIHAEKREEKEDPKDKKTEGKGVKDVFYYTLFLITTGSISGEGKSQIPGISDSLRRRLLFYQYYFASISEPKCIRIILVVPHDTDISPEAKSEVFEEYKIGLWKVDVKQNKKQEEVTAEFFRNRMVIAFNTSVKDPEDVGEAIKSISEEIKVAEPILIQAVEKRAEEFSTFFEQYVLEAVEAIAEISPEQIGKRYIDRKLIDKVFELRNVSCIMECRDLVNEHLNQKIDDYLFSGQCFGKLWKNTFDMDFPTTLGDYEQFLQKFFPQYREHFVHQFQVFLLGTIILDHLLEDPSILFKSSEIGIEKDNLLKGWLLTSSIHDFTYPLQKYDKWSEEFFRQQLDIDNPPRFLDLRGIYVEKTFLSRVELLLSNLEKDFTDADPWEKAGFFNEIRRFFYYEIAEKKNHGLMGSSYLLKKFEKKSNSELSKIVLPAAVASAIHDDDIWQILSGQLDTDAMKEWEYIRKILNIDSSGRIESVLAGKGSRQEKSKNIGDMIKETQGDWTGRTCVDIYSILDRKPMPVLSLRSQPLAFLLILCDNLQDCERPCEDLKWKTIMEALDIRLREIIPDIKSKRITIQMHFNDVTDGSEWRSEKTKTLKKMENLLKSPDIEFKVEYWDRGTNSLRMHFTIH